MIAGFKEGRGPLAKDCGQPLEAGRRQRNEKSHLELPEGIQPC